MIPTVSGFALEEVADFETRPAPSRTYQLDLNSKRIVGMIDGKDAITQMIYKTLQTERYAWLIYGWDYGMELEQYLGLSYDYIAADLERAVTEALLMDDRVLEIKDFAIEKTRIDALCAQFTAVTTEGDTKINWEVQMT